LLESRVCSLFFVSSSLVLFTSIITQEWLREVLPELRGENVKQQHAGRLNCVTLRQPCSVCKRLCFISLSPYTLHIALLLLQAHAFYIVLCFYYHTT
jgi:hypothetical protein